MVYYSGVYYYQSPRMYNLHGYPIKVDRMSINCTLSTSEQKKSNILKLIKRGLFCKVTFIKHVCVFSYFLRPQKSWRLFIYIRLVFSRKSSPYLSVQTCNLFCSTSSLLLNLIFLSGKSQLHSIKYVFNTC